MTDNRCQSVTEDGATQVEYFTNKTGKKWMTMLSGDKQIISRKYTLQSGSYDFIAVLSLSSNKGFSLYSAMGESERGADRRFDIDFATWDREKSA
jgi:hypothetical protein